MPEDLLTKHPELAHRRGTVFVGVLRIITLANRLIIRPLARHFRRRYAGRYRHARTLFAFDMVLLTTIAVLVILAVYFTFLRPSIADKISLRSETAPTEITSGKELTFTIFYENRSKVMLTNVDLVVRLPPHFQFLRSFPKEFSSRTSSLFLEKLEPGAKGQAKVTGVFWGEVGGTTPLYTMLTFIDEKTSRRGVKFMRSEFRVAHSVLQMSLELPERLVAGQSIPFTLHYRNSGAYELPLVSFAPDWPQGSGVIDTVVPPDFSGGKWLVGALAPGAEGAVTGQGRVDTYEGDRITLSFRSAIELGDDEFGQGRVALERPLVSQPLKVELSLDDASAAFVKPGETIKARIAYVNTSDLPIHDAEISLDTATPFTAPYVLPDPVAVGRLEGGARGTTLLTFRLYERIESPPEPAKNFILAITPVARGFLSDGVPIALEVRGPELRRKIETMFGFRAVARYWTAEGDQIGRGPIPPVANETTKYWVFWTLEPTSNDLEHLEFSMRLPENVEWTGRSNVTVGSPLAWNGERRTVTWTTDQLPATLGTGTIVSARFEVALTPTFDQIGHIPTLTHTTRLTGRDLFTETDLEVSAPPMTTNLETDRRARGKAVVETP